MVACLTVTGLPFSHKLKRKKGNWCLHDSCQSVFIPKSGRCRYQDFSENKHFRDRIHDLFQYQIFVGPNPRLFRYQFFSRQNPRLFDTESYTIKNGKVLKLRNFETRTSHSGCVCAFHCEVKIVMEGTSKVINCPNSSSP